VGFRFLPSFARLPGGGVVRTSLAFSRSRRGWFGSLGGLIYVQF